MKPIPISGRLTNGFTLMELLVVVGLIAVLTAIAVPTFRSYLGSSRGQRCSANILLIESAKDSFIIDHPGQPISTSNDLSAYLKFGMPACPSGGTYNSLIDRYARVGCSAKTGNTLNGLHDYGQP